MLPHCLPCRVLPRSGFLQITAQANPCSRHLWGTLARAVASIWWHQATPKNVLYLLSDSCILKCRQVICTKTIITLPDAPSSSSSTALPAPSTKSAFLCACGRIGNRVQASGCDWTAAWPGIGFGCRYLVVIGLPPVINPPINNTGAEGRFDVAEGGLFLIVGLKTLRDN